MKMGSFVAVTLLCLGLFVTFAASAELPLMPPLTRLQVAPSEAPEEAAPGVMTRLIRLYFGDQVRWWPFLDWSQESAPPHCAPHRHHRVVREYRPRHRSVKLAKVVKLADVVKFHLRGNPVKAPVQGRS